MLFKYLRFVFVSLAMSLAMPCPFWIKGGNLFAVAAKPYPTKLRKFYTFAAVFISNN